MMWKETNKMLTLLSMRFHEAFRVLKGHSFVILCLGGGQYSLDEAKAFGVVDEVIASRAALESGTKSD